MSPTAQIHRRLARPVLAALALLGAVLLGLAAAGAPETQPQVSRTPSALPAPEAMAPKPAVKPVLDIPCTGQRFIGQRIACYSDRAVEMGDPTLCLRADSPDVRWPCVAKYAVVAGSAATCRLLTDPARTGPDGPASDGQAADGQAADGDAADGATTPDNGAHSVSVDLCLSTLALVYRRPDLCRQLTTETMDDACLAKLVANGGDPALCREIESAQLREVCVPDPLAEVAE